MNPLDPQQSNSFSSTQVNTPGLPTAAQPEMLLGAVPERLNPLAVHHHSGATKSALLPMPGSDAPSRVSHLTVRPDGLVLLAMHLDGSLHFWGRDGAGYWNAIPQIRERESSAVPTTPRAGRAGRPVSRSTSTALERAGSAGESLPRATAMIRTRRGSLVLARERSMPRMAARLVVCSAWSGDGRVLALGGRGASSSRFCINCFDMRTSSLCAMSRTLAVGTTMIRAILFCVAHCQSLLHSMVQELEPYRQRA